MGICLLLAPSRHRAHLKQEERGNSSHFWHRFLVGFFFKSGNLITNLHNTKIIPTGISLKWGGGCSFFNSPPPPPKMSISVLEVQFAHPGLRPLFLVKRSPESRKHTSFGTWQSNNLTTKPRYSSTSKCISHK